ncbi:protein transporter tim9 [Ranunculus cassubicifolius]
MDKSMLENLEGLPAEDQQRMANMIENLQLRDSLRMYNGVVQTCFTNCVDSFRRKTLDKQEESCVKKCTQKFLNHSMRVGMRFAELNEGAATKD